jgi:oligopeptide transport system substrate-binding protein
MMRSLMLKLFFCFSLLLTACQKKEVEKQSTQRLNINIVDDLSSLDPRKARDLNSMAVMKMLYEGLTRISKDGKIEPALAKSIKVSLDKKTYTFKLKESFWTDGTPLTSYDFAKSWKKVLEPAFPSTMSYKLFIIEGAKEVKEGKADSEKIAIFTPDSSTIIVKLIQPAPYFLELLSMPVFFPIADKLTHVDNWEEKGELYLGNGPFKIVSWKHNNLLELKKNESYWDKEAVKLRKLSLFMVCAETELNMFETKKIDWAGSPLSTLPVDAIKSLSKLKFFFKQPFLGTSFIRINTQWCSTNFDSDKKSLLFRKALAYSIERENIATHILHGSMEGAGGFLPTKLRKKEFFFDKIDSDLVRDFKSLAFNGTIKLSFINNDRNNMIVQALQREWEEKLNLKVELESLERKVYLQKLATGNYELALSSWIADFSDIMNFLEVFKFKNNGTNNTFWENAEYIDLLNRAEISINEDERNDYLQKAHEILMNEMPIIPVFHLNMCYLKNENIKDSVLSPVGCVDYRWAYIDRD